MIFLGLVLVLLLGVGAYRLWAQAPVPENPAPDTAQEDGVRPLITGNRKKDFYTFLLVGRDTGGGGNTDTLMLAAYDVANQQASLMSIPRDTMVDVDWDVKKINSVYNHYKDEGDEAAADALRDAVAELVGFRPDFSVVVEWQAVGDLVEALGGVWFEVPFDMYYEDDTQGLYINQAAGYRLLSGADAMQIVRWRKNNCGVPNPPGTDGSDLGRAKLQQDFMAAALKQCLRPETLPSVGELAKVFTRNVRTGLSAGNLVWFAEQALLGGFSTENLYTCTMPNTPRDVYSDRYHTDLSYVLPRAEELAQIVNDHFNPYTTQITLDQMNVMTVNADGSVSPSGGAAMK